MTDINKFDNLTMLTSRQEKCEKNFTGWLISKIIDIYRVNHFNRSTQIFRKINETQKNV